MRFSMDNFLYAIKQIVTGRNGDDTPVAGGLLPGTGSTISSSAQSADGGIKVDDFFTLADVTNVSNLPAITDSTGGTPSTTFAAIAAGASYAQADIVAIKNALSQIAKQLNGLNLQYATQINNVPVIDIPTGGTTIGTLSFSIPRDYDEASDHLFIRVTAAVANAADAAVTLIGTPTFQPVATGTPVTVAAVTGTAPFSSTTQLLKTTPQVFEINLSGNGLKRDDIVALALTLGGTPTASGPAYIYAIERTFDSCIVSYHDTDTTQNPSTTVAGAQEGFGNPLR